MIRLIFNDETSNKFWEIDISGRTLIIHFGRMGTAGQTKEKSFESETEAQAAYSDLVAEKLKKGYVEDLNQTKKTSASLPGQAVDPALKAALEQIDKLLSQRSEKDRPKLLPGAATTSLESLSQTVFAGQPLPQDLHQWYSWHDGQKDSAGISPADNRTLLSIEEAIDTWNFLNESEGDIQQPWKKCWLPLFTNGAGDYRVYETSGAQAGQLIGYWHNADDRAVEFASLLEWAKKTTQLIRKSLLVKPWQAVPFNRSGVKWEPVSPPNNKLLSQKPVGTLYAYKGKIINQPRWLVVIKLEPDAWVKGTGTTEHSAIECAELDQESQMNAKSRNSDIWAESFLWKAGATLKECKITFG